MSIAEGLINMSIRTHCVSVRFSPTELALLDSQRGRMRRGAYLRSTWGHNAPAPVPAINLDAWRQLARAAANLNQLAYAVNSGRVPELSSIRAELATFRSALVGPAQ